MRRPIRLNRSFCKKIWPGAPRGCPDPRRLLDAGISDREANEILITMKIQGVFKTTWSDRFPETTRLLANRSIASPPVILDVGASDGCTSLSVMQAMPFSRYYVTDRHIEAHACTTRKGIFFCDDEAVPFMFANRFFVIYNEPHETSRAQSDIVGNLFAGFDMAKCREVRKVPLMNRALLPRLDDSVRLQRYDIFQPWPHEQADLVIAANILNRDYFADAKLVDALRNLRGALKDHGTLAVIENRPAEQSNTFRLEHGRFIVEDQIGPGSDIQALVTGLS
ncbi:MAG: class I SAM-dependent methyltransferase [Rhodanobacteraceae bacterium]|nr:MAG: class I SAM-dependent methyltransferase [Rhodanobacteraceae bacterium]